MLLRIVLAAAAFAGLSVPAAAQGCQRSRAPTVTFAEAILDERPSTHCVEIEAVVDGHVLVEDGMARYRPQRAHNDPSSNGALVGFYAEQWFDVPTRVRVVGRLTSCEAITAEIRAREPEAIVFLSGYCHYYNGRVFRAVHVEPLGPANFVRMLPGDSDGLGNLSPLGEGGVRDQMLAAAERYRAALRNGDRDALAAMHGGGRDGQRSRRELDEMAALLFDDPESPFAALRSDTAVTTEIFGWKPPLWADDAWRAETSRTGTADAIACFSTSRDAAMLWPIDSKDADNIPGRPYACTRIHIGSTGIDAPASFDTEQARSGVEEPIVILPMRDRIVHQP